MESNPIKCPKCGSTQITANKKGFSTGKAITGAILTGGIGLLAGNIGSSKITITCLACGKEFKPGQKKIQTRETQLTNEQKEPLFDECARIVVETQQGSASLLQRKLKIGYNRAGRIIDQLQEAGIIGAFEGSKAREVKIRTIEELEKHLGRPLEQYTPNTPIESTNKSLNIFVLIIVIIGFITLIKSCT